MTGREDMTLAHQGRCTSRKSGSGYILGKDMSNSTIWELGSIFNRDSRLGSSRGLGPFAA